MKPFYATVDVGGTKVLAAIVNKHGEILARSKSPTEKTSTRALLDQIETHIARAAKKVGLKTSQLRGIALGVPGVVSRGVVTLAPNVPLTGVELERKFSRRLKQRVVVGNDGSFGTLGETIFGAGQGRHSCYGFFIGTGIGGGLVLNRQIWEGARGLGGEIGHLLMPISDGTLNGLASNRAVGLSDLCSREGMERALRQLISQTGNRTLLREMTNGHLNAPLKSGAWKIAMQNGDELVGEVVGKTCQVLGLAAASVSHLVDPELIIFGGGVIEACGEWMMPQIITHAQHAALMGDWSAPNIAQSALGDDAVLLGGAARLQQRD